MYKESLPLHADAERFGVTLDGRSNEGIECSHGFWQQDEFLFTGGDKKGFRTVNVHALIPSLSTT